MDKKKRNRILLISLLGILVLGVAVSLVLLLPRGQEAGNKADVEWYDESVQEFIITTADELYDVATLSAYYDFKGQTIKLGADIVVNEGNAEDWAKKAPKRKWFPIQRFAGTFDGQGYTISGLYGQGTDIEMGLFNESVHDCVIKNFRLVNSYFANDGDGAVGSIIASGSGTVEQIYSDAIVVGTASNCGGLIGEFTTESESSFMTYTIRISNCWFDGEVQAKSCAGGIIGVAKADTTMEHCLNSAPITTVQNQVGGLIGVVNNEKDNAANVTVKDSLNVGILSIGKGHSRIAGSIIGYVTGGEHATVEETYASVESWSLNTVFRVGGSGATLTGNVWTVPHKNLTGIGGYEWTFLDFDNYWTVQEGSTPILKAFAETTPSLTGIAKRVNMDWYNQYEKEFVLETAADLYGLSRLSIDNDFKGITIKLGADIVINEGDASTWDKQEPEYSWIPISSIAKAFAGTFDGQGHSISGMYCKEEDVTGLFQATAVDSAVKNLKILNSYFECTGKSSNDEYVSSIVGSVTGRAKGTFDTIYSDAIVKGVGRVVGGIIGQVSGAEATINNCWFDGKVEVKDPKVGKTMYSIAGGIAGGIDRDTVVSHCLNTGTISCEGILVGGIIGSIGGRAKVTIEDCLNVGKVSSTNEKRVFVYSIVGNYSGGVNVTIKNTYATKESSELGSIRVESPESRNYTLSGGILEVSQADILGTGAYQQTYLDFAKYWVTVKETTPQLKSFATGKVLSVAGLNKSKKAADISWYQEGKTEYIIQTIQQLNGLAELSKTNNFAGKTVKIASNLTMNEGDASSWGETKPDYDWTPIGSIAVAFAGTFDGQGYTISGLYCKNEEVNGLFRATAKDSTVKNLRIENSYFECTGKNIKDEYVSSLVGSVAGRAKGTFDTIYSNAIVKGVGRLVGGLIGQVSGAEATINNCWFDGKVEVKDPKVGKNMYSLAGGIVGSVDRDTVIAHCLNTGTISCEGILVGGLIGSIGGKATVSIEDCLNVGKVSSSNEKKVFVYSIVGNYSSGVTAIIKNTYATKESSALGIIRVESPSSRSYTLEGTILEVSEADILGYNGYRRTYLDFDTHWVAVEADTPKLKCFTTSEIVNVAGLSKAKDAADVSWYNESSKEYTLYTIQQLNGLASISKMTNFAGKTVKLGADLSMNDGQCDTWGTTAPEFRWTPISTIGSAFAGTFDGQGHTISGLYAKNTDANGLFVATTADSSVKNLKITNSYFESTGKKNSDYALAIVGSIAGRGRGNFDTIYSEAIVKGAGRYVGGLIGHVTGGKANVTNSWFAGNVISVKSDIEGVTNTRAYAGGLVGAVEKDTTIQNCLNTGSISAEDYMIGGIVGVGASVLKIQNSLNAGRIETTSSTTNFVRSVVGAVLSEKKTELTDVYATIESCEYDKSLYHKHPQGTEPVITGDCLALADTEMRGTGGYKHTNLDLTYWAVRKNQIPGLKSFVADAEVEDISNAIRPDTSWFYGTADGSEEKPYQISDEADLYGLAKLSKTEPFTNKHIQLTDHIVLNGNWLAADYVIDTTKVPENKWTPIGQTTAFAGIFDGQGYTISGLYVKTGERFVGLFGKTASNSIVGNFQLTNSYLEYTGDAEAAAIGSVVGYASGELNAIYSDAIIKCAKQVAGGLVGFNTFNMNAKNCWYEGTLIMTGNTAQAAGGIIGRISGGTVTFEDCLFTGKIQSNTQGTNIGGICGHILSGNAIIKTSFGAGNITDLDGNAWSNENSQNHGIGAVIGRWANGTYSVTTKDVYGTKGSSRAIGAIPEGKTAPYILHTAESNFYGIEGYKNADFDFCLNKEDTEGVWTARTEKIPGLKLFVKKDEICDVSEVERTSTIWYTEHCVNGQLWTEYTITSAAELYGFAQIYEAQVNANTKPHASKIYLADDIVLNEGVASSTGFAMAEGQTRRQWMPIGRTTQFLGVLDGQGHTISGLYVVSNEQYTGLFAKTATNTIFKNLSIINSYLEYTGTSNAFIGSFSGRAIGGTFGTLYTNAIIKCSSRVAGGFFGFTGNEGSTTTTSTTQLVDCWSAAKIYMTSTTGTEVGGISGKNNAKNILDVQNCLYTGEIDNDNTWNGSGSRPDMGGFCGLNAGGEVKVKSSLSAGKLLINNGSKGVGSIIGTNLSVQAKITDVYANNSWGAIGTNNAGVSNAVIVDAMDKLKGTDTIAEKLDYENYWKKTDNLPSLKSFVK